MKVIITCCLILWVTISTYGQIVPLNKCIKYPALIQKNNFSLANSAFSTSETRKKGLFLIEIDQNKQKTSKFYQHPTWTKAGYLGSMIFDNSGNLYTYPTPHVNLIDNPPQNANIIYKVDGETGQMNIWKKLFTPSFLPDENVFGIMGMSYSCPSNSIYVSTVIGSTQDKELGKIYQIDVSTGFILDSLTNFDGFGLSVLNINQKNYLLCGNARNSTLYYVELNQVGGFQHVPKPLFSIEGMGPRGDDRIKKISYKEKEDALFITGYEFFFNLSATLEKQENVYAFRLDKISNRWIRIK